MNNQHTGLLYRIESAIGNREYRCGRFHLTVSWCGIFISWLTGYAALRRNFPGVSVELCSGDTVHEMYGFTGHSE
jgi:hypothetical protein